MLLMRDKLAQKRRLSTKRTFKQAVLAEVLSFIPYQSSQLTKPQLFSNIINLKCSSLINDVEFLKRRISQLFQVGIMTESYLINELANPSLLYTPKSYACPLQFIFSILPYICLKTHNKYCTNQEFTIPEDPRIHCFDWSLFTIQCPCNFNNTLFATNLKKVIIKSRTCLFNCKQIPWCTDLDLFKTK